MKIDYRDCTLPVEQRVHDLLGRMTLGEKAGPAGGVGGCGVDEEPEQHPSAGEEFAGDHNHAKEFD